MLASNVPSTPFLTVMLAADSSSSSVSRADVTGLSFNVLAGVTYRFKFNFILQTSITSTAPNITVNGPATTQLGYVQKMPGTTATSELVAYRSAFDFPISATGLATANADHFATIEGIIKPSSSGVLIARLNSSTAAVPVSVKAGSSGELLIIG